MKKGPCWAIGLTVTALTAGLYWIYPPVLHRLELMCQNAHFQVRGPVQPGPEVAIIAIDEKSVDELGRWPWSRKTMSRLVEKLVERQVRVIGFDMVFSSPHENPFEEELENLRSEIDAKDHPQVKEMLDRFLRDSNYDAQFASTLRKSDRAVMGYFFHFRPEGLDHLSQEDLTEYFQSVKRSQFSGFLKSNDKVDLSTVEFPTAYAVEANIPVISDQVRQAGNISFNVEPDGSIRKIPLIVRYRDKKAGEDYYFPPLSIRVLEKFLEGSFLFRVGEAGAERVLLDSEEPINIPTNEKGELLINFLGKGGAFPYYSATDLLHDRSGLVPENSLRDKIVLIGATAAGLEDLKATPFDPVFPGVEFHATVIDNILRNSALRQPFWLPLAGLAYLLALGILLTFLYSRIKPVYGIFAWVAVAFLMFSISHLFFINQGFWLTDIFPLIENTLIIAGLMTYRYRTEEKQKQYIKTIFGQYLSTRVVDELLKNPAKLKLGGEQKELTAFFTDLKGFTTLSEKLPPEELIRFLNDYLRIMTDILLKHEGTLDKYDGDASGHFSALPFILRITPGGPAWLSWTCRKNWGNFAGNGRKRESPNFS